MSLGISVDIVKAATQKASMIVAQINSHMPRTQGDGFINIKDVDFIIPHDEPLLEYTVEDPGDIIRAIGKYVARIIEDESTLQVGYGIIPNAVVSYLGEKKHLGVHTELLSDGIIDLMKKGVVDNTKKSIDMGKTVTAYCMGKKETYEFLDENPTVAFKTIDYVNNPLIIAKNKLMTAINSAMEIDLTGQAGWPGRFHERCRACAGWQEYPGPSLNSDQRHHFEDSAISPGGNGSDSDQRGCPLCSD
jgi:acyl-CoA hydrolase